MRIDATEYAIEHLSIIGYYRLSSYWYHMEIPAESEDERSHNFLPGTTFEDVVRVYVYTINAYACWFWKPLKGWRSAFARNGPTICQKNPVAMPI